jgi:hypothetical protein
MAMCDRLVYNRELHDVKLEASLGGEERKTANDFCDMAFRGIPLQLRLSSSAVHRA